MCVHVYVVVIVCVHACVCLCVTAASHVACSHFRSKMPPDLLDDSDMMQLLSIAATRLEHMQVSWEGEIAYRCEFRRIYNTF